MSVQLIVYPQSYDGFTNSNNPSTQFIVDGINFSTVNTSTNHSVTAANGLQEAIDFYNPTLPVNTWKRYFQGSLGVTVPTTFLNISVTSTKQQQGILQKLSNLTVGCIYNVTVDINTIINVGNVFNLSVFSGTILQSSHPFPPTLSTGISTFQFIANSTDETLVIGGNSATGGVLTIASIGIFAAPNQPSEATQLLEDGQVILDLYEDEDLPLSLSVDDFKNVAEQVQSYSKAFNLPATKRNNRVFDHIFEITREVESAGSLLFNPYKRTTCILKQDGFVLFKGYLKMLDISDKEGEISYNVNLYSEVVALADILQDRTFSNLGFEELNHDYNKTNIKRSWNDAGNSITYLNPSTSGFRDAYTTLRYPFVDWNRQWLLANGSTGNNAFSNHPELTSLEQAFRPFINIKYIIDRIFEATDFTYESSFFNEDDFKKLYMDFNWGSNNNIIEGSGTFGATGSNISTTSFTNIELDNPDFSNDFGWNDSDFRFVAPNNGTSYIIDYEIEITMLATNILTFRWVHLDSSGNVLNVYDFESGSQNVNDVVIITGTIFATLQQNDTLQAQFKTSVTAGAEQRNFVNAIGTIFNAFTGIVVITTDAVLQKLRGELGQWEFLKGIITMFNLVTLPDENNPNNIKIEPYQDVFVNNPNSAELNWTEKIDVSEMKLTPLTDLNRKTIFKFVEDDDDFAFNNYKNLVGGHLYGSLKFDATNEFNILEGEKEVIAEPFAATVVKPLHNNFPSFVTPSIYAMNQDGSTEGFENSPRIMYNNGIKSTGASYYIPEQNGLDSEQQTDFLQFSHLSLIPSTPAAFDFHFGECQLIEGVGNPTAQNLFNLYWLPYYLELYNPNTRTMTIRVNLTPADINTFKFNDTVYLKNKTFRVNKIDYKPNDLATVEFILIP